jgi:purine-nucleoside phosphorylase
MSESLLAQQVLEAVEYVRARTRHAPKVGVVLGSGLGTLADSVSNADVIPYEEIPNFPRSTVPGHSGRLVIGGFGDLRVMVMQGRVHYYEGYPMARVTFPVRLMQSLGLETLIVTNASGGVRPGLRAGDLMAIVDHINFAGMAGHNPLRGPNDERWGERFPAMDRAYDAELLQLLREVARERNIALEEGVYAMVSGPSYETPAEVRFLRTIGADAVGMSTAPEVTVARHAGMRVAGVSVITNVAVDELRPPQVSCGRELHEEVLEAGQQAVPKLAALVEGLLHRLG